MRTQRWIVTTTLAAPLALAALAVYERPAAADANRTVVQVSADDPFYGLPAVSEDGSFVALPVRHEAGAACAGDILQVHILATTGKSKPQVIMLADGCKKVTSGRHDERKELRQNVPELNDMLAALRFQSMSFHRPPEGVDPPFDYSADDVVFKVKGKGKKLDVEARMGPGLKQKLAKKAFTTKLKKVKTAVLMGIAIVRFPNVKPLAFAQVEWMIPEKTRNTFITEWTSFELKGLPPVTPKW